MRPQRQLRRQVEAAARSGTERNRRQRRLVRRRDTSSVGPRRPRREDLLPRHPEPVREHGAQALVPGHQIAKRLLQRRAVERTRQPHRHRDDGRCAAACPPAAPGTTAGAAHRTAGSRQGPAAARSAARPGTSDSVASLGASSATLGASNRLRIATSTLSTARMRPISRVASSECPPSSKKLSSTPTRGSRNTSANSSQRMASCGLRGARRDCAAAELRARAARGGRACRSRSAAARRARHTSSAPCSRAAAGPSDAQRGRRRAPRPARRHHIGDQPLAAGAVAGAPPPRPATCRALSAAPPRSRPARSGSRGASPGRRRGPGTQVRRRLASAPGRRCGTSANLRDHAGRQRTAPRSGLRD